MELMIYMFLQGETHPPTHAFPTHIACLTNSAGLSVYRVAELLRQQIDRHQAAIVRYGRSSNERRYHSEKPCFTQAIADLESPVG